MRCILPIGLLVTLVIAKSLHPNEKNAARNIKKDDAGVTKKLLTLLAKLQKENQGIRDVGARKQEYNGMIFHTSSAVHNHIYYDSDDGTNTGSGAQKEDSNGDGITYYTSSATHTHINHGRDNGARRWEFNGMTFYTSSADHTHINHGRDNGARMQEYNGMTFYTSSADHTHINHGRGNGARRWEFNGMTFYTSSADHTHIYYDRRDVGARKEDSNGDGIIFYKSSATHTHVYHSSDDGTYTGSYGGHGGNGGTYTGSYGGHGGNGGNWVDYSNSWAGHHWAPCRADDDDDTNKLPPCSEKALYNRLKELKEKRKQIEKKEAILENALYNKHEEQRAMKEKRKQVQEKKEGDHINRFVKKLRDLLAEN